MGKSAFRFEVALERGQRFDDFGYSRFELGDLPEVNVDVERVVVLSDELRTITTESGKPHFQSCQVVEIGPHRFVMAHSD